MEGLGERAFIRGKNALSGRKPVLAGLLRQLCEDAGLVQTALGERLGRNQTYVSNVEPAIRRLDLVELGDYCLALKVSLPDLIALWEAQIPRASKSRRASIKRKGLVRIQAKAANTSKTMTTATDPDLHTNLASTYEEMMWLANRPHITASAARAWYTHVTAARYRRHIRRFSGKVSLRAVADHALVLRLEHFMRIQTTLTQLVARHVRDGVLDPGEFTRVVLNGEQVHIVTMQENYEALKAKGDYTIAGISLVDWDAIPVERQHRLWKTMLNGKVANASDFAPTKVPS